MSSLMLIAAEYRADLATLAELDLDEATIADTLDGMGGELQLKAQNVALFARQLDAEAAAIKQWARDAADRAKAIENRAERLRKYLGDCMQLAGVERIDGPGVTLSWRKSQAVVIDEPALLAAEWWRQKPAPEAEPDKSRIADALKHGAEIAGAHIEHRRTLTIK